VGSKELEILIYKVQVEFHKDFVDVVGDQITVGIKSKPIGGAANKEIIKKLAKHFGVSSASITIKSGHKSKEKIIEISSV
jgi:hypothetical protein